MESFDNEMLIEKKLDIVTDVEFWTFMCFKYSVPGSYSRDKKMCNKKPRQESGMVLFIDLSVGNHIMPNMCM